MARFYLDECMSRDLIEELQDLGHDAVHCRDLGFGKYPDYRQLLHAFRDSRVLVTKDQTHFGELHGVLVAWARKWNTPVAHSGILTVPDRLSDDLIALRIHQLVVEHQSVMDSRFYDLSLRDGWIEKQV